MNPSPTSTPVPQDLPSLARQTAAAVARWTFGCMALSMALSLALHVTGQEFTLRGKKASPMTEEEKAHMVRGLESMRCYLKTGSN